MSRYQAARVLPSSAVTVTVNSMTRTVMPGSGPVPGGRVLPRRRRAPFLAFRAWTPAGALACARNDPSRRSPRTARAHAPLTPPPRAPPVAAAGGPHAPPGVPPPPPGGGPPGGARPPRPGDGADPPRRNTDSSGFSPTRRRTAVSAVVAGARQPTAASARSAPLVTCRITYGYGSPD